MKSTIRHYGARVVLTVGLAAGVWGLAATSHGAETGPPAIPATAVAGHALVVAQAPPPAMFPRESEP